MRRVRRRRDDRGQLRLLGGRSGAGTARHGEGVLRLLQRTCGAAALKLVWVPTTNAGAACQPLNMFGGTDAEELDAGAAWQVEVPLDGRVVVEAPAGGRDKVGGKLCQSVSQAVSDRDGMACSGLLLSLQRQQIRRLPDMALCFCSFCTVFGPAATHHQAIEGGDLS